MTFNRILTALLGGCIEARHKNFATLSKTGGIANLYEALKLAMAEQTESAKK